MDKSILIFLTLGFFLFLSINTVSAVDCWDYDGTDRETCEGAGTGDECSWDEWGQYCMEKGCWDYWNQTSCEAANASGCFWRTDTDMGWQTGWCEDKVACWNYWDEAGCTNVTGCLWRSSKCEGPPECDGYNDSTSCTNSGYGCWWDSGNYCYKPGCWDYKTNATCSADSSCQWKTNSYCTQVGGACWNYNDESSCTAAGCKWDGSWCSQKYCYDYTTNATCSVVTKCMWTGDNQTGWCTEKGCWNYWNETECTNDAQNIGNCNWNTVGQCENPICSDYTDNTTCSSKVGCFWDNSSSTCKYEGCWNYGDASTCNATTGCQWKVSSCRGDSGCSQYSTYDDCVGATEACWWDYGNYCKDIACWDWDYTNATACENDTDAYNLDCEWDSYWSYCNEKWCGSYPDETSCNSTASGKCYWSTTDNYCYEESCWGISNQTECEGTGCTWGNWSYCSEVAGASCYDFNQTECTNSTNDDKCRWDSYWGSCQEKGCWDFYDNATCIEQGANLTVACTWVEETGGGWCEDSGVKCWEFYTNDTCVTNNCTWDSTWNTCNEKGCWNYWDQNTCNDDANCNWTTGAGWGWCEKRACWNFDDTNSTMCETNATQLYGLNCTWQATAEGEGWCYGPWQANCWQYELWHNASAGEGDCMAAGCTWENKTGWCFEQIKSFVDFTTEGECIMNGWGMWNGTHCVEPTGGVSFAGINPGCWIFDDLSAECSAVANCTYNATTTECSGLETVGVQCADIKNQTLCEGIPMLSTCCKWQAGQCNVTYEKTCWDQMDEPPAGATHCMDYNAIDSPTLCNQIAGSPWYMPCKWNNNTGQCGFKDDMATDVDDVKTKKNCEFLGGTWKTETVCDSDTENPTMNSWCEMPTGASTYGCDLSCWTCNSSTSCSASKKGYCVWTADANLPQGGFCDIPDAIELQGDCDKFCGSCEYYTGGDYTPQEACQGSAAQCKWDNATSTCVQKKSKSCSDDCFSCFDKETCTLKGGGSQGTCKWDDYSQMCEPASFDGEICFDAMDNDKDDLIDCEDAECMYDPFCGGGDMGQCWLYLDNSSCVDNGCSWFQDPWTQTYRCGMKGESCWIYESNQTGCDADANCQWFSEDHCEVNHTKADTCFTYTGQTNCEANTACKWEEDSFSPQGGWCDFAPFECEWNQTLQQSKTKCESNSLCVWNVDPGTNEGRCEPKCFARDANDEPVYNTSTICNAAISGGLCEWSTGWCEPNTTVVGAIKGRDCAMYDDNRTDCEQQPGCAWFEQMMGGPIGGGGFSGSQCEVKRDIDCYEFNNQSACNTSLRSGGFNATGDGDACRWVTEGTWSWCEPLGMHCGPMYAPFNTTTGKPQTNTTGCAADPHCMVMNDTYMNNNTICVPKCHDVSLDQPTCEATNTSLGTQMCVWLGAGGGGGGTGGGGMGMGGWCDPVGMKVIFEAMEGGKPHEIASDDCGETSLNGWTDACFMGIKEMPDDYGIGIGLNSMTYAAVCNGETLWDGSTGSGYKTTKGYWYLDTDGNESNNCKSDDGYQAGFEFRFSAVWEWSNDGLKETLTAKRCLNGNWSAAKVALGTHRKKMCQELQGMIITVRESDLDKLSALFNPTYPMRIYAVTAGENGTKSSPADRIGPGYYQPGKVDFKVEDCGAIGNVDMDDDGFYAYEDPDCKYIYMDEGKGFKEFEDCFTPQDDDGDGSVNCDDTECKYETICGGTLAVNTSDHEPPSLKKQDKKPHLNSANIIYKTEERANGTLLFYGNDSTCTSLNATIRDPGLWNENNTDREKYRFTHVAKIDNRTHTDSLNYSLDNATAYYYKIKVCDISGNCAITGCLNFTTKSTAETSTMKFDDPDSGEDWQINKGTGNYTAQGAGCAGKSNSTLGDEVNPEVVDEVAIKMEKSSSNGNITIEIGGIDTADDVISDLDVDTGTATGGTSGATEDYVWMNESGWGGNDGVYTRGNPDNVTLRFPGSDTKLINCENKVNGVLTDCTDITDDAIRTYNSTGDYTEWVIPSPSADLWSYMSDQTPSTGDGGDGGGGGGGGGTTGGGGVAGKTYVVTDEQLAEGYTKELSAGDRFKFVLENETHYVTVDSITSTTVTINVTSETQQATLSIGEEKKFEITGDNYYDLSVKLNGINATSLKADITIKKIFEQIVTTTTVVSTTTTPSIIATTTVPVREAAMGISTWMIGIIGVIAVIVVIVFLVVRKQSISTR